MNEPDPIVKAPPTLLPNGGRPHMKHIHLSTDPRTIPTFGRSAHGCGGAGGMRGLQDGQMVDNEARIHQYKYNYGELKYEVERAGFRTQNARGLVHVPRSLPDGAFYTDEFISNAGINSLPEESYVFYLECVKV